MGRKKFGADMQDYIAPWHAALVLYVGLSKQSAAAELPGTRF